MLGGVERKKKRSRNESKHNLDSWYSFKVKQEREQTKKNPQHQRKIIIIEFVPSASTRGKRTLTTRRKNLKHINSFHESKIYRFLFLSLTRFLLRIFFAYSELHLSKSWNPFTRAMSTTATTAALMQTLIIRIDSIKKINERVQRCYKKVKFQGLCNNPADPHKTLLWNGEKIHFPQMFSIAFELKSFDPSSMHSCMMSSTPVHCFHAPIRE